MHQRIFLQRISKLTHFSYSSEPLLGQYLPKVHKRKASIKRHFVRSTLPKTAKDLENLQQTALAKFEAVLQMPPV